jgi:hypothetical protein
MPSGRTSRPGLQATDLLATLPACSGRKHNQLCRLSHECKLGDQTKDDADKEPREERSCGRSQTSLYNETRTHLALDKDAPVSRPVQRIGVSVHALSWAHFITATPAFKLSVHTAATQRRLPKSIGCFHGLNWRRNCRRPSPETSATSKVPSI